MNEVEKTYPLITGCTQNCIYKNNWKALKEWLSTLPGKDFNDLTNWQDCVWDEDGRPGIKKEVILNKMNELEGDK